MMKVASVAIVAMMMLMAAITMVAAITAPTTSDEAAMPAASLAAYGCQYQFNATVLSYPILFPQPFDINDPVHSHIMHTTTYHPPFPTLLILGHSASGW